MKNKWQTKKLSDVCFFQEGPGIRKYEYKKNGYPIINVRCVQDGYIDLSNAQAVDPKFIKEKWAHFQVEEGDILFTTSGTIGRTAMAKKDDLPLLMNTSVVRFKSLNEKELDRYFLAWLLCSPKFIEEVKSYSSGTAQKNVGPTHLKLISISHPSLSEQKRIVKILDEVFEKIEKAKENVEKNLKNSKELFESYLQNVFANPGKDWEEKTLGEVCGFVQGVQVDAHLQKETKKDNQVRFLRIIDFTQGNELPRYIDNPGEKYIIGANDVSLVRYGASTGFVCRGLSGVLANNLFRVIPKNIKQVSNEFLFTFLKSSIFQNIIKRAMGGAAMPAISFGLVKDIPFSIASISEQKSIVKKLNELSEQTKKLEEVYKKKLADLEELKKSILNKAFSGEL